MGAPEDLPKPFPGLNTSGPEESVVYMNALRRRPPVRGPPQRDVIAHYRTLEPQAQP